MSIVRFLGNKLLAPLSSMALSHGGKIRKNFYFGGQKAEFPGDIKPSGTLIGAQAKLRKLLFGSVDLSGGKILQRGTSRDEAQKGPAIFLGGISEGELGIHAIQSERKAVSFTMAGWVSRQFVLMQPMGSIVMLDSRLLNDQEIKFVARAGEGLPEFEMAVIKNVPPACFIGYQNTIVGVSTSFICNELYIDVNSMTQEIIPYFREYIENYHKLVEKSWVEKGADTYSGAGPVFSEDKFEEFIKLNVDFYSKINEINSNKPSNVVVQDEDGNEIKPEEDLYDLKEVETALRDLFMKHKKPTYEMVASHDKEVNPPNPQL